MKINATKDELINFFIWFRTNEELFLAKHYTIEELVIEYLEFIKQLENKGA